MAASSPAVATVGGPGGEERGVQGPGRGAGQQLGHDAALVQGVHHPGLHGAQGGTSAGVPNAPFLASPPPTAGTAGGLAAIWRGLRRTDVLPLRTR